MAPRCPPCQAVIRSPRPHSHLMSLTFAKEDVPLSTRAPVASLLSGSI